MSDILSTLGLPSKSGDGAFLQQQLYGGWDFKEVQKALSTSSSAGENGSALIGESLDAEIKMIVQDPANFCPKQLRYFVYEALSVNEEYVRTTRLGRSEGMNRQENDLGVSDSPDFTRIIDNAKFYGVVGAVSRTQQRVGSLKFGDNKALVADALLKHQMRVRERDLFWADSTLNGLQFDGMIKRAEDYGENVKDLISEGETLAAGSRTAYVSGPSLTISRLRDYTAIPLRWGGFHTAIHISPEDKISIENDQDAKERYILSGQTSSTAAGQVVDQLRSTFGPRAIDLVWDYDLWYNRGKLSENPFDPSLKGGASDPFHEDSPALLTTAPTAALAAAGNLPNDEYFYAVSAVNQVGEGPIKPVAAGVTTTNTNGKVQVTIAYPTGEDIDSFRVYRSTTSTAFGNLRLVDEVASDGTGSQVFTDDGTSMPGSRRCMLVDETKVGLGNLLAPTIRDLADITNAHQISIDSELVLSTYDGMRNQVLVKGIGGSAADPA